MLGPKQEAQSALFYDFSIEDHVPADHILRAIEGIIDLSGVRQHLSGFYSATGRPSVDPDLMMRMLLVGYIMGIRSERRLCDEVHLNLAYRWFCKLDLTDPIPDHSTFSKNRHGRFRDSDLLRHLWRYGGWAQSANIDCKLSDVTIGRIRGPINLRIEWQYCLRFP